MSEHTNAEIPATETAYGCLFCRSGKELALIKELEGQWPDVDFIVPTKRRIRRIGNRPTEESTVLFPGYIFVRTAVDFQLYALQRGTDVYRVLRDQDHQWQLHGRDRQFAEKLFQADGEIQLSHAYYVDEKIHIVDGFLKDYEGEILAVNHRAKTAKIQIDMQGQPFFVWLGFELIESEEK